MIFFDEHKLDTLSDDELRALRSVRLTTTVRSRHGRVSVTDGPFAETNECLGGTQ